MKNTPPASPAAFAHAIVFNALTCLLVALTLSAAIVRAADVVPAATSNTTASTVSATPAPATGIWDRSQLTGDWGGLRSQWSDAGFAPFGSWTGEIWDNTRGGLRSGMTQDMLTILGFDEDLGKAVGWNGTSVHAEFHWLQGQSPDANTKSFNSPTDYDAVNHVRVYSIYAAQKLAEGQVSFRAGQFGADSDFFQTDSAAMFVNAGFTAPPTLFGQTLANGDLAVPQYPVAAPGVFARFDPKNIPMYAMAGVYDGDPGPDKSYNHGFDWKTGNSAVVIGEIGQSYKLGSLAGTTKVGGFYHGGTFRNWNTGGTGSGVEGLYAIIEQTFLQGTPDASGNTSPVLTGYGYAGWAGPDSRVAPDNTVSGGVNWHGPIPGRDNDVAGLAVLYTEFSADYTSSAFNPNGPGATHKAETVLEATYNAAITPWFNLQPDVQFIFNPANAPTSATAVVIGARVVVAF